MDNNFEGKPIYNQMIDEEYELDEGEELIEEQELKNQLMDGEVNVSDDSQNYLPTPPNDDDDENELEQPNFDEHIKPDQNDFKRNPNMDEINDELNQFNLDEETKSIFKFMTDFIPQEIEVRTELKPFVPDYIPAVGEVDAFLKIPRPDKREETLGLQKLDEPALNMKKKSYLDLLIKEFFKGQIKDDQKEVHALSNVHKNPKQIETWIKDVDEIQKKKVAPSVFYSKRMPEIDSLMQTWEPEFESVVSKVKLNDPSFQIPLELLTKVSCNLLDIPVHQEKDSKKNMIESLHVMFSLYASFMANDHFHNKNQNSLNTTNNIQRIEFNQFNNGKLLCKQLIEINRTIVVIS